MTIVDVQFSPAHCDWAELRDACLAADQAGFGAMWVYDHLAGESLGGTRMLECFSLLGALAELTSRIELGTMVVNVWNRGVGTLLTAAASVTAISGRQFHLGIGAGSSPTSKWSVEQRAVGAPLVAPLAERHRRVDEVFDLAERMWADERSPELATFPRPTPRPTLLVGASGPTLSALAGRRADGINVGWHHPRRAECLAAADDAAERAGRSLLRTVWTYFDEALFDPDHPQRLAMREARIDRLVLAELGRPPRAERLLAYAAG